MVVPRHLYVRLHTHQVLFSPSPPVRRWTGRWIAMDSVNRRFPRLLLAPILCLTMVLGGSSV